MGFFINFVSMLTSLEIIAMLFGVVNQFIIKTGKAVDNLFNKQQRGNITLFNQNCGRKQVYLHYEHGKI